MRVQPTGFLYIVFFGHRKSEKLKLQWCFGSVISNGIVSEEKEALNWNHKNKNFIHLISTQSRTTNKKKKVLLKSNCKVLLQSES